MDHHCPWIYNCVGYKNHKYFFLLVIYSAAAVHMIVWTMMDSVKNAINTDAPFFDMFTLLFGETLAMFVGVLITVFLFFHMFLMLKDVTTIEWCEKTWRSPGLTQQISKYNVGIYHNICEVFGPYPLLG